MTIVALHLHLLAPHILLLLLQSVLRDRILTDLVLIADLWRLL